MIEEQVLFSKKDCEFILNFAKDFYRSEVIDSYSDVYVSESRTSYECIIVIEEQLKKLFLEKLKAFGVKSLPNYVKIIRYSEGTEFMKHKDASTQRPKRYRSLSIQLNDTYEDGELKIWGKDGKEFIASKELGNAVIFDSGFYHQALPPSVGTRYSAVLWLSLENMGNSRGLI